MFTRISALAFLALLPGLSARAADYVCVVTVQNAGDAARDSSAGPPKHIYVGLQTDFLGRQTAEQHAEDFLLHVHYYAGKRWLKNPYGVDGSDIVSSCVPFDSTTAAKAYLTQRYPGNFSSETNAYVSRTNFDGRPES